MVELHCVHFPESNFVNLMIYWLSIFASERYGRRDAEIALSRDKSSLLHSYPGRVDPRADPPAHVLGIHWGGAGAGIEEGAAELARLGFINLLRRLLAIFLC